MYVDDTPTSTQGRAHCQRIVAEVSIHTHHHLFGLGMHDDQCRDVTK